MDSHVDEIFGIRNSLLSSGDSSGKSTGLGEFSAATRKRVHALHCSLPGYSVTPLRHLRGLASKIGIADIWVKDESFRFGLNAFKGLGASYAIAMELSHEDEQQDLSFSGLRESIGSRNSLCFVTATDGNHGRAVAWMAKQLGAKSVVYMPRGSEQIRVDAIRSFGAQVEVLDGTYDDAVAHAANQAAQLGWKLIQDTAWQDYTRVPLRIMQGYSTLLTEIFDQLKGEVPTHVFLQAGVGSMAAAIQAVLIDIYGEQTPKVVIVEPIAADCFYKSAEAEDGRARSVVGHLDTSMAGLACGTPSTSAWDILKDYSEFFFKCADGITEQGMRVLANPVGADEKIISGESGAVTTGLLVALMDDNKTANKSDYNSLASMLSLGADSRVLLISTEGDTDPENYKRVTYDP
jgi:diaminopropionate ammonia-lyase